jgi:regulator of RNase E activity RraA
VFGDDDGCLFVHQDGLTAVLTTAWKIWKTERRQAEAIQSGDTLRSQLKFSEYLEKRAIDPAVTFRQHLRGMQGAIEE